MTKIGEDGNVSVTPIETWLAAVRNLKAPKELGLERQDVKHRIAFFLWRHAAVVTGAAAAILANIAYECAMKFASLGGDVGSEIGGRGFKRL